ncbi:MAG TPA: alkaline phosphatase family protein [Chthoniobacteraceae bacterium]|nr:alkaline phosphatase family protein [Chthoniobacteraceae bacterium]
MDKPAQKKLLVIDIAALGSNVASKLGGFFFQNATSAFPAVTCVAQADFRTATPAGAHGLVSNGLFFPNLRKVLFWEQAAALVQGPRIWDKFRARGGKVGMMFWQQSLGESVDMVLSPAPIHKHSGGMIQDCYSEPRGLYGRIAKKVRRNFNLMHYWGPLASRKSSDWIVAATCALMSEPDAPGLLLTYIPHLDYDLQRHGPDSPQAHKALDVLAGYLGKLQKAAADGGYEWLIFGDYAIEPVTKGAVFPNRALREAGLFATRNIKGMAYADFFSNPAFAIVDHQAAHVHTNGPEALAKAKDVLQKLDGVAAVLDREQQRAIGVDHEHGGDLLLVAAEGAWFAYPWWTDKKEAPDYATHVDIHNKPGYDPCELFFGWPPPSVSMDTTRIHGTHGRGGAGSPIVWASSLTLDRPIKTFLDLAAATKSWLDA